MHRNLLFIFLGSGLGGALRYIVGRWIQSLHQSVFPWGTFFVNVAGCLLIGLIYALLDKGYTLPSEIKLFLTVGLCGGFTTFSTFIHENYLLFQSPRPVITLIYAAGSLLAGFLALYAAYFAVNIIWKE